jgi:RHS repeat-associated protein
VPGTFSSFSSKYVYDGDRVIEEYDGGGVLQAEYIYGIGIDEVVAMERGANRYHFVDDGLGSVAKLVDNLGADVEVYTYDAYGAPTAISAVSNPHMFTGREYDSETGLYYYRARMYNPTIGRFLQNDSIGHHGAINLYEYVHNNPVNYVDSDGQIAQLVIVGGGALIGAAVNAKIYYQYFKSGRISGSNYAKLIGVGAATGAVSTLGNGILSGALLGGFGSAINDIAAQKIIDNNVNLKNTGEAFAVGLGVGFTGGVGVAIGRNIIRISDNLIVGGSPVINYGHAGGLIGDTAGTIITNGKSK